ncbi:MAG TPA: P1 family peptidase [Candidatus Dormibacteraeota bacterium]
MAITDVPGVRVGHWTDAEARTGCTVVLLPDAGAVAGVDVRGPAPGTRETDLLRPGRVVERVHAICLCGGSAFGLGAADGVMRFLRERDVGLPVGPVRVPLVPTAVLFDLAAGTVAWPGPDDGYAACLAASDRAPEEGPVGAGTGATVGKLLGREGASPGGAGTASVRLPGGAVVGALAVVNAVGDVHGRDGRVLAGARQPDGRPVDVWRMLLESGPPSPPAVGASTTIAVVATDAALDKAGCRRLAEVAQDGLALAVRPAHTPFDGDAIFAVSTGEVRADALSLGVAAAEAMWRAIERAVTIGR